MRILCIENTGPCEKGKWYNCEYFDTIEIIQYYLIKGRWYRIECFKTVDEIRKDKLEELDIN